MLRRLRPGYLMAAFLTVSGCALFALILYGPLPQQSLAVRERNFIYFMAGFYIWLLVFYRLLIETCRSGPAPDSSVVAWQPLEAADRKFWFTRAHARAVAGRLPNLALAVGQVDRLFYRSADAGDQSPDRCACPAAMAAVASHRTVCDRPEHNPYCGALRGIFPDALPVAAFRDRSPVSSRRSRISSMPRWRLGRPKRSGQFCSDADRSCE